MRVLEKIATLGEYSLLTETKPPLATIGMQFVANLLQEVDEDQKDSFKERVLLPKLISLRIFKEVLVEVLQGVPRSTLPV